MQYYSDTWKKIPRDSLSFAILIVIILHDKNTNGNAFVGYDIFLLLYTVEMQWFFVDDEATILWSIILVYEKKFQGIHYCLRF